MRYIHGLTQCTLEEGGVKIKLQYEILLLEKFQLLVVVFRTCLLPLDLHLIKVTESTRQKSLLVLSWGPSNKGLPPYLSNPYQWNLGQGELRVYRFAVL